MDFGERYGYTFEHEATYDRMCLVNDAVYIAKYKSAEECQKMYGYVPGDNKKKGGKWTATVLSSRFHMYLRSCSAEKTSHLKICARPNL